MSGRERYPQLGDSEWLTRCVDAQLTNREIAAELGCTTESVAVAVRRFGLIGRRNRPRVKHARVHDSEWMAERVAAGLTTAAIAAEVGCTIQTVQLALRRFGLTARRALPPPRPRSTRSARIAAMWSTPMTLKAIGAEVGITESGVSRAAARMGLPSRQPGTCRPPG